MTQPLTIKRLHLVLLLSTTIILTVLTTDLILSRKTLKENLTPFIVSPYILDLTQPVTGFMGKVTGVDNNRLIVNQIVTSTSANSDTKTKTIPMVVILGESTTITSQTPLIPYLFRNPDPATLTPNKLTSSELKPGFLVTVSAKEDLRLVKNNQVEAVSLLVSEPITIFSGTIAGISDNQITLEGTATMANGQAAAVARLPETKSFNLTVDENTEISRHGGSGLPLRLELSDLVEGDRLQVYSIGFPEDQSIIARRIEPIVDVLPATPKNTPVSPAIPALP